MALRILNPSAGLLLGLVFLGGCQTSPTEHAKMLALSPQQFAQLSPETISAYDSTYHHNLQVLSNTISTSKMPRRQRISVAIHGGMAAFSPEYSLHAFQASQLEIPANRCVYASLTASRNLEQSTRLSLCYLNDTLYVDPSSTNANYPVGSLQLPVHYHLTQVQQFCQLNSQGNIRLRDSCISISHANTDKSLPAHTLTLAPVNSDFIVKPRVTTDENISTHG